MVDTAREQCRGRLGSPWGRCEGGYGVGLLRGTVGVVWCRGAARQGGTAAACSGMVWAAHGHARAMSPRRVRAPAGRGAGARGGRRGSRVRRGLARAVGWSPPQERHGGMATGALLPGDGDERRFGWIPCRSKVLQWVREVERSGVVQGIEKQKPESIDLILRSSVLGKNRVVLTTCSTKCLNQFQIQIFENGFHH